MLPAQCLLIFFNNLIDCGCYRRWNTSRRGRGGNCPCMHSPARTLQGCDNAKERTERYKKRCLDGREQKYMSVISKELTVKQMQKTNPGCSWRC